MPPIVLATVASFILSLLLYGTFRLLGMGVTAALQFTAPLGTALIPTLDQVIKWRAYRLAEGGQPSQFVTHEGKAAHRLKLVVYGAMPLVLVPQLAALAYGALGLAGFFPYLYIIAVTAMTAHPLGALFGVYVKTDGRMLALLSVLLGGVIWGTFESLMAGDVKTGFFFLTLCLIVGLPASMFGFARGQQRGLPNWVVAIFNEIGIGPSWFEKLAHPPSAPGAHDTATAKDSRRRELFGAIGSPVRTMSAGTPGGGDIACAACGNVNASGSNFCTSCGTTLVVECWRCEAELSPGQRFCGLCGAAVVGSAAKPDGASPIAEAPFGPADRRESGFAELETVGT